MAHRRIVVGLDGSPHSRRAAAFVARLAPTRGGRVTFARVVEPVRVPATTLISSRMRAVIAGSAAAMIRTRQKLARRQVEAAVTALRRSGWRARGVVAIGIPFAELLSIVRKERADLLVVGARGAGTVKHFLLGSVAEAALKQSPVEVLIVK